MKKNYLIFIYFIVISIILFVIIFSYLSKPQLPSKSFLPVPSQISLPTLPLSLQPISYEKVVVLRVIDGDTIELGDKRRVRYIGINTPETKDPRKGMECYGKEASDKNKELVEGKTVYLEKDISNVDKFNRLLRYVYLDNPEINKNALFVNEYLVKEGFAQVSTFPPDVKYVNLFLNAQENARKNNKGLWSKCRL